MFTGWLIFATDPTDTSASFFIGHFLGVALIWPTMRSYSVSGAISVDTVLTLSTFLGGCVMSLSRLDCVLAGKVCSIITAHPSRAGAFMLLCNLLQL